jgi:DUF1680 family protein
MDGVRKASAHEIVFQARPGSPELNCCSVNGSRGFGFISDWALMSGPGGLFLNWYGPGTITAPLPSGNLVTLEQVTDYPCDARVRIKVGLRKAEKFALKLRIPHWSRATHVQLNARQVPDVRAGEYLVLDRTWKRGDTIALEFDFSLHFWVGEKECANRVSIYRGPLLLTYDRRLNAMDPDQVPALKADGLQARVLTGDSWLRPMLLLELHGADGRTVRLCDFGSAGVGGNPYRSWLEVEGVKPTAFSRRNPLRRGRFNDQHQEDSQ